EDGRLVGQFRPPEEWAKVEAVRADVAGSSAQWTWRYAPGKTLSNGTVLSERTVHLWYRDTGDGQQEGYVRATVQAKGDRLTITGTIRRGKEVVAVSYRSRPEPDGVELEMYLQSNGEMTQQVLDTRGSSLEAIRAEHQLEVDELLSPILQKLAQKNVLGLGAGDVYRLFDGIRPDPTVMQRLEKLLPRLDSDSVRERQAATEELKKLGRPGVLAAMRQDVSTLSPEQRSRLERFIVSHRRLEMANVEQARKDLNLVMACFEDEDSAVRVQAKRVAESLLGYAVAFDPAQGFEQRRAALKSLRDRMEEGALGQPNAVNAPAGGGF
ncbi:MAG TPA: hypothetical protein VHP11_10775, partial [Tepidisphaeraceae bacterium]|nr:hypothetical protein [Tepidisphaeraceae bacterium]